MPPTEPADGAPRWGFAAVFDGFRYLAGNTRRADVLRRRPDRDGPGHAAGTVPADGARKLRRSRRRRHHDGPAGRGDVGGRGGGRGVLRLAAPHPQAGSRGRDRDHRLGSGDGRLRHRGWARGRTRRADAVGGAGLPGARWRPPTWCRRRSARRSCSRPRPTILRGPAAGGVPGGRGGWPPGCRRAARGRRGAAAPRPSRRAVGCWWWSVWWSPRSRCLRSCAIRSPDPPDPPDAARPGRRAGRTVTAKGRNPTNCEHCEVQVSAVSHASGLMHATIRSCGGNSDRWCPRAARTQKAPDQEPRSSMRPCSFAWCRATTTRRWSRSRPSPTSHRAPSAATSPPRTPW